MGTREDVRTVKIEAPVTLDDLRWMVDHCDGLDGQSPVEFVVKFDLNGHAPEPTHTPAIIVHGKPMIPRKPAKVYRTQRGPGDLPSMEDRAERRW
jgi:hypothetical protein